MGIRPMNFVAEVGSGHAFKLLQVVLHPYLHDSVTPVSYTHLDVYKRQDGF